MNSLRLIFIFSALLALSCQNDDKRLAEQQRDAKAKELIFTHISNGWNFTMPPANPKAQSRLANWSEMRLFLNELNEKPKSSIGAFQKKARALSQRAKELGNNIPAPFNKPEVRSRISVLTTKINSIDLYLNLDDVADQKVIANVVQANEQLAALYRQMDEIIRKSEIPKEQGEADMIRMLDTARAIPTPAKMPQNPPQQGRTN